MAGQMNRFENLLKAVPDAFGGDGSEGHNPVCQSPDRFTVRLCRRPTNRPTHHNAGTRVAAADPHRVPQQKQAVESSQFSAAFVQHSDAAITVSRIGGIVTNWNPAAEGSATPPRKSWASTSTSSFPRIERGR